MNKKTNFEKILEEELSVPYKIKFNQLSLPLKIGIITAYVIGSIYLAAFIIGFISAIIGI